MNEQENDRLVMLFSNESDLVSFEKLQQEFKDFEPDDFCAISGIGPAFIPGNLISLQKPKGPYKEGYPKLQNEDRFCLTEAGKNWRYRLEKERKAIRLAYVSCVLSGIAAIAAVIALLR